jgi:hypothetical protein
MLVMGALSTLISPEYCEQLLVQAHSAGLTNYFDWEEPFNKLFARTPEFHQYPFRTVGLAFGYGKAAESFRLRTGALLLLICSIL